MCLLPSPLHPPSTASNCITVFGAATVHRGKVGFGGIPSVHSAPDLNAKGGPAALLTPEAAAGTGYQQQLAGRLPGPQKPPIRFASGSSSVLIRQQLQQEGSRSSSPQPLAIDLPAARQVLPVDVNMEAAVGTGQLSISCKQQQQQWPQQVQVQSPLSPAAVLPARIDGGGCTVVSRVLQRQLSLASATAGASGLGVLHVALHSGTAGLVCGWQQQVTAVVEPGERQPAGQPTAHLQI